MARRNRNQPVRGTIKFAKREDGKPACLAPGGRGLACEIPARILSTSGNSDRRPEIKVTADEHDVNDEAAALLSSDNTLYQRGGMLVRILRDQSVKSRHGIDRPRNAPRIDPIQKATLQERLTRWAKFVVAKSTAKGVRVEQVHPPAFCVSALMSRGYWPGVRFLEGIVDSPILRPTVPCTKPPGTTRRRGSYMSRSANRSRCRIVRHGTRSFVRVMTCWR